MRNPLDALRTAFDKAVGPFVKRQKIMAELKEPDVGKERRAQLVNESKQLDEEWLRELIKLRKIMDTSQAFQERLKDV